MTVCVECGAATPAAYRWYSSSVVKLEQCEGCGSNVDKYVEFDGVLVCLDVLLHRKPAFRHVIYNSSFKPFWKLGIVYLICTSYTRWATSRLVDGGDLPAAHNIDALLLYAMELKFYLMFALSVFDFSVFLGILTFLIKRFHSGPKISALELARGLVLFSYARLVAVPVLIWGEPQNIGVSVQLANLLLLTSYIAVVSVLTNLDNVKSFAIVFFSYLLQTLLGFAVESLAVDVVAPRIF